MNLKIASRDHCWWHLTTCQHGSVSISTLLITSCGVLDGSKILSFVDGLLTRLWITVKLVVVSGSSLCTPPSATWWCPTSKWMIHPFNTQMDDPQTKSLFCKCNILSPIKIINGIYPIYQLLQQSSSFPLFVFLKCGISQENLCSPLISVGGNVCNGSNVFWHPAIGPVYPRTTISKRSIIIVIIIAISHIFVIIVVLYQWLVSSSSSSLYKF